MALEDTCLQLESSTQEALCEVCTVELQLPGAEKLCLFGNQMLPRKRETLMHTSWDMPYTAQQDEVVYATDLADEGCSVSDYAGLAGKIVLVPMTRRCTLLMTVRSAEQAGVKAYILVSAWYYLQWYRVWGTSHRTSIPVHTVDYHAAPKLQAFISNGGGRHIPGTGYALDGMAFTRGVPPPTDPPSPAPLPPVVVDDRPQPDTSPDFELSVGTAVCIAVVCVDVVVLAVLFALQHHGAVQLPDEVQLKTFSIPLKVASMGLSLTLLLLIAVVSFTLTERAGQDSTDKAMSNGRAALGLSYDSSEKNTVELSGTIRDTAVDRVIVALQNEIHAMEDRLEVVEDLYLKFDGSWAQFAARSDMMLNLMHRLGRVKHRIQLQIFTTRGFFLNDEHQTDDRPDYLRNDGVVGSVWETQQGWRYGVNDLGQSGPMLRGSFSTIPTYEYNASRMLAGNIGDPLAVTAAKPKGHSTWMAGQLTFPLYFHRLHPMAVYRPLYGFRGKYHGTIEAHMDINSFVEKSLSTLASSRTLQNMTVLLVDGVDKAILGQRNTGTDTSRQVGFVPMAGFRRMSGLYYMHSHPSANVTALANYLDSVDGWKNHAGEFDQQEHFSEQTFLTLAKITVSGGRAADTSVHAWDVEMRDGACGACVAYDPQLQKQAMLFDGATTLHLYRNLTRRTPFVAQSQVSGPGEPWRSRYDSLSNTMTLADGTECVSHTWRSTATDSVTRCMVRHDISETSSFAVSMRIRPDVAYTDTSPRATTPRLFSDTLVGDANIRLFANGQLYLYVLQYGCRTKAYENGFPVHTWTTVTAVVGGGFCRVYVNGTLYSEGVDARLDESRSLFTGTHGNPQFIGQYFRGRIDSLQLFPGMVSAQEVMSLHTRDRLVRDVERKRYFAQTKALDMNVAQEREGVQWTVAVMLPRDDIMRVVDANRRETLADVQVQEDNTKKELTQRANATIMVIVAIAMTSVVVFLVFNNMLTQPVRQFAHDILRVSQADVEGIDTVDAGVSVLREINVMRSAMTTLVQNMREYKTFMPEAIFEHAPDFGTSAYLQDAPGLQTGHAAVLFTDVQGSTKLWEACTDAMAEALRLHNTVIRKVITVCGGYEVKTIGDSFMVSFADLDTAVQFGLRAQERLFRVSWPADLLEVVQVPGDDQRGLCGLRVRMGLTYGTVNVEHNEVVRRCDYFGPTVNRAARLESNGVCGGVAVETSVVAGLAAVHKQQAVVVPLGTRSLKGIGDVPLSLLVPASMPQRAAHALKGDNVPNPLQHTSSNLSATTQASSDTNGSANSLGATKPRRPQRTKLLVVDRFSDRLSEIANATVGYVDCEVGDVPAAEVTALTDSNLRRVVASLGRSDGRLLNVCGTAALVAWNVMAPCAGHLEGALRFACLTVGRVHCGLCSGKVFSGYVGTGKQRFVTAVGQCVQVCQFAYVRAVEAEQTVMFASQDTQVTNAMQVRGLATAAADLHRGGNVYAVCAVLCSVVTARLDTKDGLFSGGDSSKDYC